MFIYNLRIQGEMIPVCKNCFQKTFDEKNKLITNAIKYKITSTAGITEDDQRGGHIPRSKTTQEQILYVR